MRKVQKKKGARAPFLVFGGKKRESKQPFGDRS